MYLAGFHQRLNSFSKQAQDYAHTKPRLKVSTGHEFCTAIVLAAPQEDFSGLTGAMGFLQASVLRALPLM